VIRVLVREAKNEREGHDAETFKRRPDEGAVRAGTGRHGGARLASGLVDKKSSGKSHALGCLVATPSGCSARDGVAWA
jgi:hypothetical protein